MIIFIVGFVIGFVIGLELGIDWGVNRVLKFKELEKKYKEMKK